MGVEIWALPQNKLISQALRTPLKLWL